MVAFSVRRRADDVLHKEQLQLLEDTLAAAHSLDDSERHLIRVRALSGKDKPIPPVMTTDLKRLPERPHRS